MKEQDVVTALGALAQETRLRILRYLVTKGAEGAAAGDISGKVDASASRTSFHLSALADAGLIEATRVSRSIIYRVNFEAMGDLIGYLVKDCCKSDSRVTTCC